MSIAFYKYEGTGNDFILIDDRLSIFPMDNEIIIRLCTRKTGIGSDGLILIKKSEKADFYMDFYNPDGSKSFCGNGSRCAVAFANRLGIIGKKTSFSAIDGFHTGKILDDNQVEITMCDVPGINNINGDFVLNTGSPHFVRFVNNLSKEEIIKTGREIRYSSQYKKEGINVNLVEKKSRQSLSCETYERGVEDETLSCGTGVTAVALAANYHFNLPSPLKIITKGGQLWVGFSELDNGFTDITLSGAATPVFKGEIKF